MPGGVQRVAGGGPAPLWGGGPGPRRHDVASPGPAVDALRDPEGSGGRFCGLLERVADEAPRVWFTTSHPSNMEDRPLRLIGKQETIVGRVPRPLRPGVARG